MSQSIITTLCTQDNKMEINIRLCNCKHLPSCLFLGHSAWKNAMTMKRGRGGAFVHRIKATSPSTTWMRAG